MYLYFIKVFNDRSNEEIQHYYCLQDCKEKEEIQFYGLHHSDRYEFRFVGTAEIKKDVANLLKAEMLSPEEATNLTKELMKDYIETLNLRYDYSDEPSYDWIYNI